MTVKRPLGVVGAAEVEGPPIAWRPGPPLGLNGGEGVVAVGCRQAIVDAKEKLVGREAQGAVQRGNRLPAGGGVQCVPEGVRHAFAGGGGDRLRL